ncbi:MAG: hypothetical protein ISS57_09290 [Anaerolineales bacterium]|nr:hypothetical protein [Anaerolineales bacterium]
MRTQIRFQPTLFIFLGTSSGQIGWRLKKLLRRAFGDVPILRFLWIDIDTDIDPLARPWFSSQERVEFSGLNPASVIKNVNNYPSIKAWWPDLANVRAGMLAGGGAPQQMRLIGRLALFRMFNDRTRGMSFIDRLRAASEALFEIENIRATEAKSNDKIHFTVERGCRVVLVFSPCGGTGSSMAFDVAYLCRHLLRDKNPSIISISVLPTVIDKAMQSEVQTQKEKIRANTYAWFREDNYLTENPYWSIQYPEGASVEVHAPPFDYRFIIDIENQAGYRLNAADDVYAMIAQAVFMDTGSSVAGAIRGFTTNVHALGDLFEGSRRTFSSLAAASLVYPKERLLDYCAHRFAKSLLEDGLLGEPDKHQVSVAASSLLSQLKLRDTDLLAALMEKAKINMHFEASIHKTDTVAAAATQIDTQETQNQAARRSEIEKLEKRSQKILEDILIAFDREIAKIAAVKGLKFAMMVLENLLVQTPSGTIESNVLSFDGLKARIARQGVTVSDLEMAQDDFEKAREALRKLDDGPEDVLERMVNPRGWKKKFSLFKRDGLGVMHKVNEISIQLAAQQHTAMIYDRIAAQADNLKVGISAATVHLHLASSELQSTAERLVNRTEVESRGYEFLQEIDVEFPAYYREHAMLIDPASVFQNMIPAQAVDSAEALTTWLQESAKTAAVGYAREFFVEDLERTSLLDALKSLADKRGVEPRALIEEYIDHLVEYCHPFWQYDKDRGLSDLEGKSIIGVEDENHSLLPDSYRNGTLYEIKTTGFRDRIDIVRIQHGLPAFLIRGMDEYKSVYDRKRKGIDPLHVLPGMEFVPDLMPEQGKQNREAFAVGLAFGYIVQIGTWYYYDPERSYLEHSISPTRKFRLGQGRENSEEAFSHRDDWVRQVDRMVDKEVRAIGNEAAIRKLDQAILDHQQAIARMTSEDTLRHQYEKEIQAIKNMQRQLGKIG